MNTNSVNQIITYQRMACNLMQTQNLASTEHVIVVLQPCLWSLVLLEALIKQFSLALPYIYVYHTCHINHAIYL
jgi:hypothetical protein